LGEPQRIGQGNGTSLKTIEELLDATHCWRGAVVVLGCLHAKRFKHSCVCVIGQNKEGGSNRWLSRRGQSSGGESVGDRILNVRGWLIFNIPDHTNRCHQSCELRCGRKSNQCRTEIGDAAEVMNLYLLVDVEVLQKRF